MSFFTFIAKAFSDCDQPSSTRITTFMHSCFACGWLTHVVRHTHGIPDAITLGGLAAFIMAPYTMGQLKSMITASKTTTVNTTNTTP